MWRSCNLQWRLAIAAKLPAFQECSAGSSSTWVGLRLDGNCLVLLVAVFSFSVGRMSVDSMPLDCSRGLLPDNKFLMYHLSPTLIFCSFSFPFDYHFSKSKISREIQEWLKQSPQSAGRDDLWQLKPSSLLGSCVKLLLSFDSTLSGSKVARMRHWAWLSTLSTFDHSNERELRCKKMKNCLLNPEHINCGKTTDKN